MMPFVKQFGLSLFLFVFMGQAILAQTPQVPREVKFADLTIRINDQARREIQLDVDALYRNPTYFKVKAERVNLYMPFVERELRDAGVPLDLKYLVIQESSLIPDAVSTSNAVGFWQFKKGTAEEVYLRVDNQVDERKNIVSSTKGAALYLKKHNATFDNWMCALVSYQMGLGGAKSYFGSQHNGKKVIDIDRNSHWYFKKFLAHKIAFENQIGTFVSNTRYLEEIKIQGPTTLKAIASRLGVSESQLKEYNKWTEKGQIPGDKPYSILYLRSGKMPVQQAVVRDQGTPYASGSQSSAVAGQSGSAYPKVTGNQQNATKPKQIKVNDINGVKAAVTTTQTNFTDQIGIRERKFRRVNDLDKGERVEAGQYYYTSAKKSKAEAAHHIVRPGETLWSISQLYGIKLSSLKAKNRIRKDKDLKAGMVLNLQDHRKRNEDIRIVPVQQQPRNSTAANPSPQEPSAVNAPAPQQPSSSGNGEGTRIVHTVLQGENLFRIGQRYNVSVEALKKWNNLSDNNIRIGQKLTLFKP